MFTEEVKSILQAMRYLLEEQESNQSIEHTTKLHKLNGALKNLLKERSDSLEEIIYGLGDKELNKTYEHVKNHMTWS